MFQKKTKINTCPKYLRGFTLLELLVVITLLGLVSTAAVLGLDGVEVDTSLQITKTEMIEIKKALRQFKSDNGKYPYQTHPADFSQLVKKYSDSELDALESADLPEKLVRYSIDNGRGWRGPYLTLDGNGLVNVGDDLQPNGTGSILEGALITDIAGIADGFTHLPEANIWLAWRQCTDSNNTACVYFPKYGRPFLLFDLDADNPRLVSMGPDGHYDGVNASDACIPNNDDLVLCLK